MLSPDFFYLQLMNYRVFLFILLVVPLADTMGQNTSLANFINCVEVQNGADDLVINGRPYFPSNPRAEGHPYFQTGEWKPGIVYVNGKSFSASHLKYNLYSFQLIVKHERPNGISQKVILSDVLVDSFQIEGQVFVNRNLVLAENESGGYLEKIFAEKLSFFRFQKKLFGSLSSTPYGRFSQQKDVFYLILEGTTHKITQQKDFLDCFPDHKAQIKKHMKDHSLKWKKITDTQFTQLLRFCYDQI